MAYRSVSLLALVIITLCQVAHAEDYVAEGYFVVDNSVVENYISHFAGTGSYSTKRTTALATLREDINYFLTEVNERFSTMSSQGSLSMEVRVRDLKILHQDLFPPTALQNDVTIDQDNALTHFEDWLKSQSAYSKLSYDFAILYTGYDLYGSAGSYTIGVAREGRVCDPEQPIAIVEFNATYITAEVTAHEIGHLLGTNHDGAAAQYIMASSTTVTHTKHWFFSACSVDAIVENIAALQSNCLLTTSTASYKPSTTLATYKGQLLDPDVTCQRSVNDTRSYMCKYASFYGDQIPKGDTVCKELYCRIVNTTYCTSVMAPEGMVCDVNKRCHQGKCEVDSSFPTGNVDASCVLGDQGVITMDSSSFEGSCSQFIATHGSYNCYNNYTNTLCCETCNKHKTNDPSCLYGDKSNDCVKYSQASVCPQYSSDLCCGFCRGFVSKRSVRQSRHQKIELSEGVIIPLEELMKEIKVRPERRIQHVVD